MEYRYEYSAYNKHHKIIAWMLQTKFNMLQHTTLGQFVSAKLKFPQILCSTMYFRLIDKLDATCALPVTGWSKSMHKMKTTTH